MAVRNNYITKLTRPSRSFACNVEKHGKAWGRGCGEPSIIHNFYYARDIGWLHVAVIERAGVCTFLLVYGMINTDQWCI